MEDSDEDVSDSMNVPGQYWFGHAHDSRHGKVTSTQTTFDDAFYATAGEDGGLFIWRVLIEDIKKSEAFEDADYLEQESENVVEVPDITESTAYSLQEEKIKAEKDKEIEDAEIKKQVTRDYIQELRNEFLKLLAENEKALGRRQIARDELNVDPDLRTDIENETQEKIYNVRRELEWISEKESIGPNKLRKKFLASVETERLELKAFLSNHSVETFRTPKLEQNLEASMQPLAAAGKIASKSTVSGRDSSDTRVERPDTHDTASEANSPSPTRKQAKPADSKSKLEARKQLRAARQDLWKELMDEKPDDSYEDPRDVAAIRYAEQHMGDYKLKTGEKYIVPDSERVDADKKRRQIMLLKESVYSLKQLFNDKVYKMRDRKKTLTEQIQLQNATIADINAQLTQLGEEAVPVVWAPTMEASAFPENRNKVSEADLANLQQTEAAAATQRSGGGQDDMGFGVGVASAPKETAPGLTAGGIKVGKSRPTTSTAPGRRESGDGDRQSSIATTRPGTGVDLPGTEVVKSQLEITEAEIRRTELVYQRDMILASIDRAVKDFDESINILEKERIILEGDLKFADMKLLLLYQEWVLLKEFEKHDNALADKLINKRNEKDDIDVRIKDCQEKLNAKKAEIEQVIKKEKDIQEDFHRALGENNKYEEMLTKMFKKKIKRSKKKAKPEGTVRQGEDGEEIVEEEEEEDEDEDDDDMSDIDEDDLSEMEAEGPDECPPDCDRAIFDRVVELRDKKLDQEDILGEIQKAIEALKKENDALIKKEKIIDLALKNTESEIQNFQTQKQQKLNELDVVVPLRLHQIQYLERNALPANLAPALVFVNDGLVKLRNRIKELQQEKADIRKQHKELKKMHVNLIKSRKEKQFKLQELSSRATDVQMLKFGQIIDLEKLERMGVNRIADELRDKLAKEDVKRMRELGGWDEKINELKEELTELTRENTVRLERLVDLTEEKGRLEDALNESQGSVTAEYSGPQKKDIQERNKLITIVQAQSAEIEALKREIEMLIRKQLPPIRKPYMGAESAGMGAVGGMAHGGVPIGTFVEEEGLGVPTSAEAGVIM
ncbi:Cilia- and flagella-associated protein 44 [Rhizophlyctis rosea]|nr:Cilia- and flagella-associated protein 44 [Rhizophlyctis rosea]